MTTATLKPDQLEHIEEVVRCAESFPYFLQSYVYILEPPPGRGIIKWEPWGYLLDLARRLPAIRLLTLLKARQEGGTWLAISYAMWLAAFKRGSLILCISQGEDEAKEMIRKADIIYEHLPERLRPVRTSDNKGELEFKHNLSAIKALPSTEKAGSGYTASLIISDEHAKHPYAATNYATLEPTINAGAQFFSISTGWKTGMFFKQLYYGAKEGTNGFEHVFFNCFLRPGRDEVWYEETKRNFQGLPFEFLEAYPRTEAEAFSVVSGIPVFDLLALERLREGARPPIRTETDVLGHLKVWEEPGVGRRYVAGADVSYGLEAPDKAVCQVLDWKTGNHVASLWGHYPPEELADRSIKLCKEYNNAFLGIEDNGVGTFAVRRARDIGYTASGNFYFSDWEKAYAKGKAPESPGYHTGRDRGPVLVAELGEALRNGSLTTWDEDTVGELQTFVLDKGKAQAAEGCHDDRVMALGIAWQMRQLPFMSMPTAGRPRTKRFIEKR